jgi:hypothetical protein
MALPIPSFVLEPHGGSGLAQNEVLRAEGAIPDATAKRRAALCAILR